MKALGSYLVVEHALGKEENGSTGIILSVEGEKAEKRGIVKSIGSNVISAMETGLKEGDVVWFTSHDLVIKDVGDNKLIAVHIKNVVAVE